MDIQTLQWDEQGLIPAIVQDEETGDVLMLAYMNEESLQKTIETKETWFYSRSRQELWNKGATSGNRQYVKKIDVDCDKDTLLLTVSAAGPACHTGERSCFFTNAFDEGENLRTVVYEIRDEIRYRKQHPKDRRCRQNFKESRRGSDRSRYRSEKSRQRKCSDGN